MSDNPVPITSTSSRIDQLATDTATGTKVLHRVIRTVIGSGEHTFKEEDLTSQATVSASTAYPHLFDVTEAAGRAMQFVSQALADAKGSLENFGDGDLSAVQTKLGLIAAQLAAAYPLVDFNRDFANVLAFIRRSTLSVSATEVDREMLNALVSALRTLIDSPTISLMDAAKLTQTLEGQRWSGSHKAVDALLRVLLEEHDTERQVQDDMFGSFAVEPVGVKS
jgi:hypothetical protein